MENNESAVELIATVIHDLDQYHDDFMISTFLHNFMILAAKFGSI